MTNQEIIELLISIGSDIENSQPPPAQLISSLKPFDHINRMGRKSWEHEADHLKTSELILLLKGVTYVERALKWLGGSVAATIWLFDLLLTRDVTMTQIDETAAWIIENTDNPYNPFGTTISSGASNYSEYRKLRDKRYKRIHQELEKDKEFRREAERQRQVRKLRRTHSHKCRNKSVRDKLIQQLNTMSVSDQLILIARDEVYAPSFYPTKCAGSANMSVIESLPPEVMHALAFKLKGRHRGPWGVFKKRLLSICGPISNKESWEL